MSLTWEAIEPRVHVMVNEHGERPILMTSSEASSVTGDDAATALPVAPSTGVRRWSRVKALIVAERRMLASIGLAFVLSRGAFLLVAALAVLILPEAQDPTVLHAPVPRWLDIFWRWDAIHYHTVAYDGYLPDSGNNAFFPLFPFLLRLSSMLLNHSTEVARAPFGADTNYGFLLSGVLVPNVLFLVASGFFYKLALRDSNNDHDAAGRALLYLSISPLALYFIVPYTESLFLATTAGCFFFLRRHQWFWAGVCGFLAALTRQLGVLLVLPFLYELVATHLRERRLQPRDLLAGIVGLVLTPLGLGLFMLILLVSAGDAFAFVHSQDFWHRVNVMPWQTITDGLYYLVHPYIDGNWGGTYGTGILHALLTLAAIVIALLSVRLWRPSYTIYVFASILLILSNHFAPPLIFQAMGRYVMVLFPLFITLAHWGRRRGADVAILVFSLVLYALCVALYVRWYPVA